MTSLVIWEDLPPELWHEVCYSNDILKPQDVLNLALSCKEMKEKVLGDAYARSNCIAKLGVSDSIKADDLLAFKIARKREKYKTQLRDRFRIACSRSDVFLKEAIKLKVKLKPRFVKEETWVDWEDSRIVKRTVEFLKYGSNCYQKDGYWILEAKDFAFATLSMQVYPQPHSVQIKMIVQEEPMTLEWKPNGIVFAHEYDDVHKSCFESDQYLTVENVERPANTIKLDDTSWLIQMFADYISCRLRNITCTDSQGRYIPVLGLRDDNNNFTFKFRFKERPKDLIVIQQNYIAYQYIDHRSDPPTYLDNIFGARYASQYNDNPLLSRKEQYSDEEIQERLKESYLSIL